MKRGIAACCIAAIVVCSVAPLSAGASEHTASIASEAASAVSEIESAAAEAESAAEAVSESAVTESGAETESVSADAESGAETAPGATVLDTEELKKNLSAIIAFFSSEEVQHLLSYKDVQDFVAYVLGKLDALVNENGELFLKIMDAIGIEKDVAGYILDGLKLTSNLKEDIEARLTSEELAQMKAVAAAMQEDPDIRRMFEEITELLKGESSEQ